MPAPLLQIAERMYSVAEVATLSGHKPEYIVRLIESDKLDAVRPANPHGGKGQWRIYPASIRRWLQCGSSGGVQGGRRTDRRAQAADRAAEAMIRGE